MKSTIFLHYQIENQESVRQKSVSDCSEWSYPGIQSNWVFCVVKKFSSDTNINFIIKMGTSWIDHYFTDPNRDPDTYLSKNNFFMYWFLQISSMKKKNTEMIVFDLFIDIESKHQIQIYFSDFHDLMSEYTTC